MTSNICLICTNNMVTFVYLYANSKRKKRRTGNINLLDSHERLKENPTHKHMICLYGGDCLWNTFNLSVPYEGIAFVKENRKHPFGKQTLIVIFSLPEVNLSKFLI